ncbi:MAG: hypothetical protein R3C05_30795, partial [Pirellulaceae bacterium]
MLRSRFGSVDGSKKIRLIRQFERLERRVNFDTGIGLHLECIEWDINPLTQQPICLEEASPGMSLNG